MLALASRHSNGVPAPSPVTNFNPANLVFFLNWLIKFNRLKIISASISAQILFRSCNNKSPLLNLKHRPSTHSTSPPPPHPRCLRLGLLDSLLLVIFTIYIQVHASTSFMSYAAAAWGIMISTAEIIGLSSRHETRIRRLCPVWMFMGEFILISLFAATVGMTIGSYLELHHRRWSVYGRMSTM
jgi:hypothetical protein